MGDNKKKGSLVKKAVLALVLLVALPWGLYFAYAKATGQPDACLFTVICKKFQ